MRTVGHYVSRHHGGRMRVPGRHGGRRAVPYRHGGRRPAIHVFPSFRYTHTLHQIIVKIPPFGVGAADQPRLPGARPVLNILFALDCGHDVLVPFDLDQSRQFIAAGELAADARSVFVCAACDVVGDADVQRAIRPVGHDVNPATLHGWDCGPRSLRRRGWRAPGLRRGMLRRHDDVELAGSARYGAGV